MHDLAEALRELRNRIAHQEPILNQDLAAASRRALALVRWSSPDMAAWVVQHGPPAPEFRLRT